MAIKLNILIDWKYENEFFIERELKNRNIQYSIFDIPNYSMKDREKKYRILILYIKYFILASKSVVHSSSQDIILCWNFTTAIAVSFICKILFKKNIILALNIIAPQRSKLVNHIRYFLFHNAMKSSNFYMTVNSKEYIHDYSKRFNIDKNKFFVLHDAVRDVDNVKSFKFCETFVFCGGEAKRDWDTMFKACNDCPGLKFICIARKKYFDLNLEIPTNVTLLFDVEQKVFDEYLEKSSVVALPLLTQLPAGLIVILRCALINKPIITTRTPATESYIENFKGGFLIDMYDYKELSKRIKQLYYDIELQKTFTKTLHDTVINKYSVESYLDNLFSILNRIIVS